MKVMGFDPFLSVDRAWHLKRSSQKAVSLDDLIANLQAHIMEYS